MTRQPVLFDDGEVCDRALGPWCQLVGGMFLDWLASQPGPRRIDIGWHGKIW